MDRPDRIIDDDNNFLSRTLLSGCRSQDLTGFIQQLVTTEKEDDEAIGILEEGISQLEAELV